MEEFYVGSTDFPAGDNIATVYLPPHEILLKQIGKKTQQLIKCVSCNVDLQKGKVYPAIKYYPTNLTNEEIGQLYGGN